MSEPREHAGARSWGRAAGLVALTGAAFALRVIGARSSIAYATDSDVVRQTMDLGLRLASGTGAGAFVLYKYPLALCGYLLGVYGALFAVPYVAGAWKTIDDVRTFVFAERELVHLIAVYALAVVGALLVPLAYRASRAVDARHGGWIAAGLVATNALLVHFGHQPRPHVALATAAFASVLLLVRVARGADASWTWIATVASALTFGVHQIGMAIVPAFATAWAWRVFCGSGAARAKWIEALAHLTAFALLCLVVYPSVVSEIAALARGFAGGDAHVALGAGAHHFEPSDVGLSNLGRFAVNVYWYQPLLTLGAVVTVPYLVWKLRAEPEALAVAGSFVVAVVLSVGSFSWSFPRVTATLVPFLALAAAVLAEDAAIAWARLVKGRVAPMRLALGILLVAPPLVTASRLVFVTARTDTRTLAREWIEQRARPGETVLANFQVHDVLPSRTSVLRQALESPATLGTVRQWLAEHGDDGLSVERRFDLVDYSGVWPREEADQLRFVRDRNVRFAMYQVRFWRGTYETPDVAAFLAEHGRFVDAICPGRVPAIVWPDAGVRQPDRVFLPEDVETDVWRHVWSVDRPGPVVLLFEVGESEEASAPRGSPATACD